jgi:hypothetical protein
MFRDSGAARQVVPLTERAAASSFDTEEQFGFRSGNSILGLELLRCFVVRSARDIHGRSVKALTRRLFSSIALARSVRGALLFAHLVLHSCNPLMYCL